MRKYENFCNALSNMKDIYNYEEPYDNVANFFLRRSHLRTVQNIRVRALFFMQVM